MGNFRAVHVHSVDAQSTAACGYKYSMGDLINPKPPQWERIAGQQEVKDDAVIALAARLMECVNQGVEPQIAVMAALRMVQKAVILNYQRCVGPEATREALRQATLLAAQYHIDGVSPDEA